MIKIDNLRLYKRFIRSVTGLIARHVLNAQRGSPQYVKFWVARPFTRILSWGRDYDYVKRYMEKNKGQSCFRAAFIDWGFSVTEPQAVMTLDTG